MRPLEPDPVRRMAGAGLIAVGVLMVVFSGLCSLILGVSTFSARPYNGDWLGAIGAMVAMLGLFSGIPIVIGVMTARAGVRILRPKSAKVSSGPAQLERIDEPERGNGDGDLT